MAGFFESEFVQSAIAMIVIAWFALQVYSMFKKQTVRETIEQIKESWNGADGKTK